MIPATILSWAAPGALRTGCGLAHNPRRYEYLLAGGPGPIGPAASLIHPTSWKGNSPKLGVAISPASALVGSSSASELRSLPLLHLDATRDRPPCALQVRGEKSRGAPVRYPCPLDRRKPNLAPALSVQRLVRYSPGSSLAQSPTASGSGVLLIWRTTQKRKAPICSRATVIPCALASSMIWVGSGPLGRSPSLGVGACALAASSACLRNSVGSMPCSVRMSSSCWLVYCLTFDLSFLSPTQRGLFTRHRL